MQVFIKLATIGANSDSLDVSVNSGSITPGSATRADLLAGKLFDVTGNPTSVTVTGTGICTGYSKTMTIVTIPTTRRGVFYNRYTIRYFVGVTPVGWKIPTAAIWNRLVTNLGGNSVAGGRMKSTRYWNIPNTGATNSSQFNAVPNGRRNINGTFVGLNYTSTYWMNDNIGG